MPHIGRVEMAPATEVFAGWWDGPEPGDRNSNDSLDEPPLIAELPLPAGKYVISATLNVQGPGYVVCKLIAGEDFDHARVLVDLDHIDQGYGQRVALNVVHEFTAPDAAKIKYGHHLGAGTWSFLKIIAFRVEKFSNQPLTLIS
jgi:hypothetical protein